MKGYIAQEVTSTVLWEPDEYKLWAGDFLVYAAIGGLRSTLEGVVQIDIGDVTRELGSGPEHRMLFDDARMANWAFRASCNDVVYKSIMSRSTFTDVL